MPLLVYLTCHCWNHSASAKQHAHKVGNCQCWRCLVRWNCRKWLPHPAFRLVHPTYFLQMKPFSSLNASSLNKFSSGDGDLVLLPIMMVQLTLAKPSVTIENVVDDHVCGRRSLVTLVSGQYMVLPESGGKVPPLNFVLTRGHMNYFERWRIWRSSVYCVF